MIDCQSIRKIYASQAGPTEALKGITFSIGTGEFVAIMGQSGSGKSTLMHILGCLDVATSGTYTLDGQDVTEMNENELAQIRSTRIGFVFQAFYLLPRATVLRNVMLPLMYAGVPRQQREPRARAALEKAALPEKFYNYSPNQISGGMMQRVAIARALANDPVMILADEPTGNLDSKTGQMVLETFQSLHRQHGRTIVLITHESDVAAYAARIVRLKDGEIIEDRKTI
ncbi:ABC transporter ATP-binding protein [Candidatus Uhrbacteria bacterium]|nr:ABC transporter ATP-binding protein [Candidatus Uhrbacteria bacterium]